MSTRTTVGALWALGQWWTRHGPVHLAAAVVVSAVAFFVWVSHATVSQQRHVALIAEARTELEAAVRARGATAPDGAAPDLTPHLPDGSSQMTHQEFAVLQSAADRAGISIENLQLQTHPATPDRLGRNELTFVARGRYESLKRFVAEAVDRLHPATVSRMSVQRADGSADVEARVTLTVWFKPARRVIDGGR